MMQLVAQSRTLRLQLPLKDGRLFEASSEPSHRVLEDDRFMNLLFDHGADVNLAIEPYEDEDDDEDEDTILQHDCHHKRCRVAIIKGIHVRTSVEENNTKVIV
jgi:hypothetical protein